MVDAFEALNQAIRLDPNYAEAVETRANVFNNVKKYDRAIEDYNEALRLDPDFALAYADRGAAWYFKGEYQKAIEDDDQAIKLNSSRAQTFTNRGAAWRKLGNILARARRRNLGLPYRSDGCSVFVLNYWILSR